MVLAYLVHGPDRAVLDSLRVYCLVVGWVLAFFLLVYARRLLSYTRPVEWQGSIGHYQHEWVRHNKRLIGRIVLAFALIFFDVSSTGTEIRRWGHDMGYWRLPSNVLGVTFGLTAIVFLLMWNTLGQDQSPDLVVVPPSPTRPTRFTAKPETKTLVPWVLATIVVLAWIGSNAYRQEQAPPLLNQGVRCVVSVLSAHQRDATEAHQALANANKAAYTSLADPLPSVTASDIQQRCKQFITP